MCCNGCCTFIDRLIIIGAFHELLDADVLTKVRLRPAVLVLGLDVDSCLRGKCFVSTVLLVFQVVLEPRHVTEPNAALVVGHATFPAFHFRLSI